MLGSRNKLEQSHVLNVGLDMLFCGALFVMALFHLGYYVLRRQDKSSLTLAFTCLFWGTHNIFYGSSGHYILTIFPQMSWELFTRLDGLILYPGPLLTVIFFGQLYPAKRPLWPIYFFVAITLIYSIFILLTPAQLYTKYDIYYQFFALAEALYAIGILSGAIWRKERGAKVLLGGLVVCSLAGLNDVLHANEVIETGFYLSLGVMGIVLSQAFVLAQRSAEAFSAVEDLTEDLAKTNLSLQRANLVKDEFLANTSHELRTPLNGIIGLSESLYQRFDDADDNVSKELNMITASGRRLVNLVNDILDISRLKNHDLQIDIVPIDLSSAVETVLTFCEPLVQNKPLRLRSQLPAGLPAVLADEDRLQQILYNLIGNAVKFTAEGEISIDAIEKDGFLRIAVRDTGIGIETEKFEEIFSPFLQSDTSFERPYEGAGLGLGISRQLVEMQDGELGVESTLGEGSTFWFSLPVSKEKVLKSAPMVETRHFSLPEVQGQGSRPLNNEEGCGHKVLIVDDDAINLQVASGQLGLAGYQTQQVSSGHEALELLERGERFDLVLLDVMMPGLSGLDVCRRIRHRYSASELPVILLTARNRLSDLVAGLSCGANDYLTKPFAREELLARVKAHLKVRAAHQVLQENRNLKFELVKRQQTEDDLRCGYNQLTGLLDSVQQALVIANSSFEIVYANKEGENLLGKKITQLRGQPVTDLITKPGQQLLRQQLLRSLSPDVSPSLNAAVPMIVDIARQSPKTVQISARSVDYEDESLLMMLIEPVKLTSISESPVSDSAITELLEQINLSGQVTDGADAELAVTQTDRRTLGVALLNKALDIWAEETGKTKVDLARESDIWKVYMDNDGWERTQTLDRYLDLTSLPQRPRWRQVSITVDFVLTTLSTSKNCVELKQLYRHFTAAR